jgi:hypothetical protein
VTNLAAPGQTTRIKRNDVEEVVPSKVSAMPAGLVNVLTREEILDLLSFLEAGDDLPASLKHAPAHPQPGTPR